jgi:dolichyl-phosphate-mannose--protein O-mannosyl transferase
MFDIFNNGVHVPVWLQVTSLSNGLTSTIVVLGNPAVWWAGFASIIGLTVYCVSKTVRKHLDLKKNLPAIFLIVVFFFSWIPYVFISRVVFIYHFYVNVPIVCLGSAFIISRYWSNKWAKILAIAYFAIVIALFILFYPAISGMPTSTSTIDSLHWFKSWVF